MILPCLILGDSTAVGTADALAAQGIRCEVHARVSAPSGETGATWRGSGPVSRALIALGSNDPNNPALASNLLALRRRTSAAQVTWLAPYHPAAARVVTSLARSFGDTVVQLADHDSRDRVHPSSYRSVATSLGWSRTSQRQVTMTATRELQPMPAPPARPYRQAVVLSF